MSRRKARPEDVGEIALALPGVELGTAWGDKPAYLVGGRSFVLYRGLQKDAVDEHGDLLEGVIVITVPGPEEKQALLASGPPWFTTDHFARTNAVLVQESRLGETTRDELAEIITDAWLARAPKRVATAFVQARESTTAP